MCECKSDFDLDQFIGHRSNTKQVLSIWWPRNIDIVLRITRQTEIDWCLMDTMAGWVKEILNFE